MNQHPPSESSNRIKRKCEITIMVGIFILLVLLFMLYELIKTKNELKFFRKDIKQLLEKEDKDI
ncbi:hypothetical protein Bmyc01_55800 [Bacillus mycoides]|nr:hypothetical protein Bmyc01_55800 [Bacillus mycoides]